VTGRVHHDMGCRYGTVSWIGLCWVLGMNVRGMVVATGRSQVVSRDETFHA
jgi:hypothetical protein